jgi:hypothetical protein
MARHGKETARRQLDWTVFQKCFLKSNVILIFMLLTYNIPLPTLIGCYMFQPWCDGTSRRRMKLLAI